MKVSEPVTFKNTEKCFIELSWWGEADLKEFFIDGIVPKVGDRVEMVCTRNIEQDEEGNSRRLLFKLRVVKPPSQEELRKNVNSLVDEIAEKVLGPNPWELK